MKNRLCVAYSLRLLSIIALAGALAFVCACSSKAEIGSLPSITQKKINVYLNSTKYNGVVLIAYGGQVVFRQGYGYRDIQRKLPNEGGTVFPLGSATALFTDTAILKLVQQGKMKLEDPIGRWVDIGAGAEGITIRQLLAQTSGLPDYATLPELQKDSGHPWTPQQLIETVRGKPLAFSPGSRWAYSNTNALLLGMAIEQVSGTPFFNYLQQQFFAPLHMSDTAMITRGSANSEAAGYDRSNGAFAPVSRIDPSFAYSAAGIQTSANDLWRFLQKLDDGSLLKTSILKDVYTPSIGQYGLGWHLERLPRVRQYIVGGMNGYAAMISRYPDEKLTVIALANVNGTDLDSVSRTAAEIVIHDGVDSHQVPQTVN